MKLPDVGEGVAEAEVVEWFVGIGDRVTPDTVIAEVLTDKATVEVSSPVDGVVVELHGEPGDVLAVGGDLIGIETDEISGRSHERCSGSQLLEALTVHVECPLQGEDSNGAADSGSAGVTSPDRHIAG